MVTLMCTPIPRATGAGNSMPRYFSNLDFLLTV